MKGNLPVTVLRFGRRNPLKEEMYVGFDRSWDQNGSGRSVSSVVIVDCVDKNGARPYTEQDILSLVRWNGVDGAKELRTEQNDHPYGRPETREYMSEHLKSMKSRFTNKLSAPRQAWNGSP